MHRTGIQSIVPPGVICVDAWEPPADIALYPEEAAAIGAVAEKRLTDFAIGRACARKALGLLGEEPGPILFRPSREPIWPAGVCGSITHCTGHWAAAVARKEVVSSIGIDAEPNQPLPDGILQLIANPAEIQSIKCADPAVPWGALLFSAKESVFKTWFPIRQTWLGFEQVHIEFGSKEFSVKIGGDAKIASEPRMKIFGRYHVGESHVFTCAYTLPEIIKHL